VVDGHELGLQLMLAWRNGHGRIETGRHRDERTVEMEMDVPLVGHEMHRRHRDDLRIGEPQRHMDGSGITVEHHAGPGKKGLQMGSRRRPAQGRSSAKEEWERSCDTEARDRNNAEVTANALRRGSDGWVNSQNAP
jgi:hypothetical protein